MALDFAKVYTPMRLLSNLCFVLLCQSLALAQTDAPIGLKRADYTSQIEVSLYKGFIMLHDEKIRHLVKSHPEGFRITYRRNTYGAKYWEQALAYPDWGFSFSYQNYLNPVLGKSVSLIPFLNLYPYRGKISSISGMLGVGFAYHTNPHHQQNNSSNIVLGSAFSFSLYAALKYQVRLTEELSAGLFIHIDHYSNGAIRKPNSGINLVQTGVSVNADLQKQKPQFQKWDKRPVTDTKMYFTFLPSLSFKEVGRGGGVILPSYNLNVSINRPLSSLSILNLGMDGFYDIALKNWIAENNPESGVDFKSVALTVGHQLMIGKVSFLTQLCYHVYRPYKNLYPEFYQRYGLQLHIHPHVALSGSLKTYLGKAEQAEWGILFKL